MIQTPKSLRLHIGIFGRRNVGKSSILNAITRQQISIVSDVAGTTTDPVEKAMELHPIGPVLFVDTAGIDDTGALGDARVEKTLALIGRIDIALLVTDEWQEYERELVRIFQEKKIPFSILANKSDRRADESLETTVRSEGMKNLVRCSAVSGDGIDNVRHAIIRLAPDDFLNAPTLIGDLISPGDLVVLVVPIDVEAPKGRLILPQVQTIRDILDNDASALVVKERELADTLARLNRPPSLVITDSQEFLKVSADVPRSIPLTSFSILLSRFKGDLAESVRGALAIDTLRAGDRVLIAEACTHHTTGEDIGRVKIPRWLEQYVGGKLHIDVFAGHSFPDYLSDYKLVVHCASCVMNRREMLTRIEQARAAHVPITNYGLAIAYSLGIFERALEPFPLTRDLFQRMRRKPA